MVMEHGAMVFGSSSLENQGRPCSIIKTILVATIGAGIQFGWALQLSLLTPYVQTLGVPHTWSSFIWLCGPLSGLLVQPIVGYYSDRCTSKLGRRRPFIIAGAAFVCVAVFLIGYAADIGVAAGDSPTAASKPRAVAVFVVGFWILDVANNMLQGPCRALLADMSAGNHSRMRTSMALFSFFIAIGNILGYAAGSYRYLYRILPFTHTASCDYACANLKTCFMFSVCLLLILTVVAVTSISETPFVIHKDEEEKHTIPFFGQLLGALKNLNRSTWILLAVTAINWIAWFPWFLFDTDWMGREIYGGSADGSKEQKNLYDRGVHLGSLGLMINAVVLAFCSLGVEPVSRLFGGAKNLWGFVNMILAVALGMTAYITNQAEDYRHGNLIAPSSEIKAYALTVFGVIGIPLAINFSVPFALASIYCSSSGGGQGLSLGILNLAIVIPQMIVSVSSGPLDEALGGGNLPAFVMGAIAAVISGLAAVFLLPKAPKQQHSEDN